mmetsp:Transcript_29770/g.40224  ORF Transcript_29770/g.40224 Transcript_29770/m.40224 type:complete len:92 (+) Transcript_29770:280-555(+)
MLACSIGVVIVIDLLLKNPNIKKAQTDLEGYNCLYYATFYGHLPVVERLKEHDVPYKPSKNGTTCLHVAVRKDFLRIAKFFLEKTSPDELN